jgi:2-polyprenyl-6-methoxyphenol hydroxylase-like FAD-dependent oxidoreductase
MRILVVGAGIGGLAAARALTRDGHEVTVYERAPQLRTTGAALTLWSNGTGVLHDLGVSTDGLGAPLDILEQRAWNGRSLMSIDVSHAARVHGHPHLSTPRRDLVERLARSLPDGTIAFGKECTEVTHADGTARIAFADGTHAVGDLVVGADGHRSAVRRYVWGNDPTTPSGWATWQGLSRVGIETARSRHGLMVVGPEGMCGLLPAGNGLLQWWFDVPYQAGESSPERPRSPVAMLRGRFGHWASPVPDTLDAVRDDDVEFFAHHTHKVPRIWSRTGVTLLGDAAHTMPPTVAQGGNQALEDAWTLARALRETGNDVPAALSAYERARSRRAGLVSRTATAATANQYHPILPRLTPNALVTRAYTRWLRTVSNYLACQA